MRLSNFTTQEIDVNVYTLQGSWNLNTGLLEPKADMLTIASGTYKGLYSHYQNFLLIIKPFQEEIFKSISM